MFSRTPDWRAKLWRRLTVRVLTGRLTAGDKRRHSMAKACTFTAHSPPRAWHIFRLCIDRLTRPAARTACIRDRDARATENNSGLEMLKQMHKLMKYVCTSRHLQAESLHSAHCTYSCVHVHYAVMHDMICMRYITCVQHGL